MANKRIEALFKLGDDSRYILGLKDNWDGEGSPGYSPETFWIALDFVTGNVYRLIRQYEIPLPRISPGPDSSIDIHWKHDRFSLLVNIPPYPETIATYFGRSCKTKNTMIEGAFDVNNPCEWMFLWVAQV